MSVKSFFLYTDKDGDFPPSDAQLMPPPSWLPNHSSSPTTKPTDEACVVSIANSESRDKLNDSLSPSKLNTPLANMLPPELADKDVCELFPEFRPGKVRWQIC